MSPKNLRILPEAQREIEEAFLRYRSESPEVADRFLEEIGISIAKISATPKLYPPYTKNTRRRILGSFPYSMIFQEKDELILLIAIAHAKRREGYWGGRIPQ